MSYHPKAQSLCKLAENFLAQFPLSDDHGAVVKISVPAFDDWGADQGHYQGINLRNADSLNAARNTLRNRVNRAGVHSMWIELGNQPFHVDVVSYPRPSQNLDGMYGLKHAMVALADAGLVLPGKITQIMQTRRRSLENLLEGAKEELMQTSPTLFAQAQHQLRNIDNWGRRTMLDADLMERDFLEFRRDLISQQQVKAVALLDNQVE